MSIRILFAEHDAEVRHEYEQYFVRHGFTTFGADSQIKCLESMFRFHPDVIVLEPEFYGENDFTDLAYSLLNRPTPLIVVTRLRAIPHVERALPVHAHFMKPVSMKTLAATIDQAVADAKTIVGKV